MGLSLLSYAVNLFIFSMGRLGLAIGKEPVLQPGVPQDLAHYADPMPQALALTAIVIGFAMTALIPGGFAGIARHGGHRPCGRARDRWGDWHDSYQDCHDALRSPQRGKDKARRSPLLPG